MPVRIRNLRAEALLWEIVAVYDFANSRNERASDIVNVRVLLGTGVDFLATLRPISHLGASWSLHRA